MKLSEHRLTEEDVKDILANNGFDYIEGSKYWSVEFETEVNVMIPGNTLTHLIKWVSKFYSDEARRFGIGCGKNNLRLQLKSILGID